MPDGLDTSALHEPISSAVGPTRGAEPEDRVAQQQDQVAQLKKQVDELKAQNARLRKDRRKDRKFGLVYESHEEIFQLPGMPIRPGTRVVSRGGSASSHRRVLEISDGHAALPGGDGEPELVPLNDLVAVARSGEPTYPGFKRLGSVERGGDKPSHVVIKGENYHALQALRFSHAGKVDCILIDPPYNRGGEGGQWKYADDFVDEYDAYRHSKWLSYMERRLRLAKDLLNPANSVLIVNIDETEYLRLGLLLHEIFPEPAHDIQMISSLTNLAGQRRPRGFKRTGEYIFLVAIGSARPENLPCGKEWKTTGDKTSFQWTPLMKTGRSNSRRVDRPNLFYPIYISNTDCGPQIGAVGEPCEGNRSDVSKPPGAVAKWPLRSDGSEGTWRLGATTLGDKLRTGHVKLGGWKEEKTSIAYLTDTQVEDILDGLVPVMNERLTDGSIVADQWNPIIIDRANYQKATDPGTVWYSTSHKTTEGTTLTSRLVPESTFLYPKSLYYIEDILSFHVSSKPEAVVLDFFAGTGTTAHAVMRLNHADGGSRQSISVTNNEMSPGEEKKLRKQGHQPGDPEWEALGIFEHITRPRIEAAVTGTRPDGKPIKGDYGFTDPFPMADGLEENVEFLELLYLDKHSIKLDRSFASLAPLLWLKAGGKGPIILSPEGDHARMRPFAVNGQYGVLFDVDKWSEFLEELPATTTSAYVVTNSQTRFDLIASELKRAGRQADPIRLYDELLSMFNRNRR